MRRIIANLILGILRWKSKVDLSPEMKRSVMIAAPHTSNWDFPIALLSFWKMKVDVKYFIKDYYTKGLFGWFFKWTGAIGVDRKKVNNDLTAFAVELLEKHEELIILVTPEGTRKKVDKWRTGFYRIATTANVPITLSYVDFPDKLAVIAEVYHPTGDFETDMTYIENFYKSRRGKYPENFNEKIF